MNVKYTDLEDKAVLLLAKHDRQILLENLWMSVSFRQTCASPSPFPAHFKTFYLKGKNFTPTKRLLDPGMLLVS